VTFRLVELRSGAAEREAVATGVVAAGLAAIALWAGPPGTDLAAHVYQRLFFLEHGFAIWNNFWYAGRYSFITYSLLYYPLAALVGIKLLALASIAAAAYAFSLLVVRQWAAPGKVSARTFAVVWPAIVLSAAFPFVLGAALALLALCALQDGHRKRFGVLAVLALAASPLAFILLIVLAAGPAFVRRSPRSLVGPAAVLAAGCLAELVLVRLFPSGGRYPFHLSDLVPALAFCGLGIVATWRVERARVLGGMFVAYGLACLAAYAVPSDVGSNISRLRYAAIPIAVLVAGVRGWKPARVVVPILALALVWNGTAVAHTIARAAGDPAANQTYWQPAISFLQHNLSPSFRVEAVDTAGHWPAEYLPEAGIPIVRGWYRQDDYPENKLLYDEFGARAYRAWLRELGVRYVVLAAATPDYSAKAEADLLRSGHSGLVPVFRSPTVTVYELRHARPIVTGPAKAHVVSFIPSAALLYVQRAGTYRVAVRYSQYWLAKPGCVRRSHNGMLLVSVRHGGLVNLVFRVSAERALETIAGLHAPRCSR